MLHLPRSTFLTLQRHSDAQIIRHPDRPAVIRAHSHRIDGALTFILVFFAISAHRRVDLAGEAYEVQIVKYLGERAPLTADAVRAVVEELERNPGQRPRSGRSRRPVVGSWRVGYIDSLYR